MTENRSEKIYSFRRRKQQNRKKFILDRNENICLRKNKRNFDFLNYRFVETRKLEKNKLDFCFPFVFVKFLQNDRRLRLGTTNGTRQRTPSSFYRQNDRVQVERSDQVCVYRRRSYLCQRKRHDPYALPIEIDSKISEKDFNDSIDETSADKDLSLPIDETNFVQEQISSADKDSLRRRSKNSLNCSTCKIKFKNKILFQNHLEKCQIENESSSPNSTKNDTLSVSLLKQETQTATTITPDLKPEAIVTEINSNQTKCQKNRLNKKSNSKTAVSFP